MPWAVNAGAPAVIAQAGSVVLVRPRMYIGLQIHHRLTQRQLSTGQFPEYF